MKGLCLGRLLCSSSELCSLAASGSDWYIRVGDMVSPTPGWQSTVGRSFGVIIRGEICEKERVGWLKALFLSELLSCWVTDMKALPAEESSTREWG